MIEALSMWKNDFSGEQREKREERKKKGFFSLLLYVHVHLLLLTRVRI